MEEGKIKSFNIKTYQLILPTVIGIGIIVWMFCNEFDIKSFNAIKFSIQSVVFIAVACLLMFLRDVGMSLRFRLITNKDLSWKQAFKVNILREFATAVLPAILGAGPTVIILLNKEGINVGRATTITITNLFLDNLFYIVVCPIVFLFIPFSELFTYNNAITTSINLVFWILYPLLSIWTFILFIGLFIRPDLIAKSLRYLLHFKVLRRWEYQIEEFINNLIVASKELKTQPFSKWIKLFLITSFTWSFRFLVANALIMAFTNINNQIVIYGRQLIIWLTMIASPTPGGSGLSEVAFKEFYADVSLSSSAMFIVITMWRLISYYFYLIVGTITFTQWTKKSFIEKKKTSPSEIAITY